MDRELAALRARMPLRAKPRFFRSAAEFRRWLEANGASESELLVGFFKAGSGKPSMSWPESVDEALCAGWIDGIRKRVDEQSYTIRFTPRKRGSIWSSVNIARAGALIEQRRMAPPGAQAFAARRENKSGIYSYEQRPDGLIEPYAGLLAASAAARKFFAAQSPSYRRAATWWVISAKKDQTRMQRAKKLIELSGKGQLIPQFVRKAGT